MGLGIIGIALERHLHRVSGAPYVLLLLVIFRQFQPVQPAIRVQLHRSFILFAGPGNIQVLRRIVVNLSQEEVVVRICRVVFDGFLINCRIRSVHVVACDPRGEKEPPRVIHQSSARHDDQGDGHEFTRPGGEQNFAAFD